MKRTIVALLALISLSFTSCDTQGDSEYTYSSEYLFRSYVTLKDTTYLKDNYGELPLLDATTYIDTMLGRQFLNERLLFSDNFEATGVNPYDADTQLYNMIMAEYNRVLPAVKAMDYQTILGKVDTVYRGDIEVRYEVVNLSNFFQVTEDSITTVTLEPMKQ